MLPIEYSRSALIPTTRPAPLAPLKLQAAKAAGMACLVTTSTYTLDDDFAAADRGVPALGEAGDAEVVGLADLNALLE